MLYPDTSPLDCQVGKAHKIDAATGAVLRSYRIGCQDWTCRTCGPRKRVEFVSRSARLPKTYKTLKFLTLTMERPFCEDSHCQGQCKRCVREFNQRFRRLYQMLRRLGVKPHYFWVNELGPRLHKHCVMDMPYICQGFRQGHPCMRSHPHLDRMVKRAGLGRIVDIRALHGATGAARYLTKYLTKSIEGSYFPYRARRAQSSRGLREVREKHAPWLVEMNTRWQRDNPHRAWKREIAARVARDDSEEDMQGSADFESAIKLNAGQATIPADSISATQSPSFATRSPLNASANLTRLAARKSASSSHAIQPKLCLQSAAQPNRTGSG